MAKDRAAPFSRKHRRYWIPVTGGMVLIGGLNLAIGYCSYRPPHKVEPIKLVLPPPTDAPTDAPGTISPANLPIEVMRAFALTFPRNAPAAARVDGDRYTVWFAPGNPRRSATFARDGALLATELVAPDPHWGCNRDADCANTCRDGAVSTAWAAAHPDSCNDGCAGQLADPPRCIDNGCVAFVRDPHGGSASADASCTRRGAPPAK